MQRADIRLAVHAFISRALGKQSHFSDNQTLQSLGLDRQDIQDLIIHLEDQFDLTALTEEEDQLLKKAITANDLSQFLLKLADE